MLLPEQIKLIFYSINNDNESPYEHLSLIPQLKEKLENANLSLDELQKISGLLGNPDLKHDSTVVNLPLDQLGAISTFINNIFLDISNSAQGNQKFDHKRIGLILVFMSIILKVANGIVKLDNEKFLELIDLYFVSEHSDKILRNAINELFLALDPETPYFSHYHFIEDREQYEDVRQMLCAAFMTFVDRKFYNHYPKEKIKQALFLRCEEESISATKNFVGYNPLMHDFTYSAYVEFMDVVTVSKDKLQFTLMDKEVNQLNIPEEMKDYLLLLIKQMLESEKSSVALSILMELATKELKNPGAFIGDMINPKYLYKVGYFLDMIQGDGHLTPHSTSKEYRFALQQINAIDDEAVAVRLREYFPFIDNRSIIQLLKFRALCKRQISERLAGRAQIDALIAAGNFTENEFIRNVCYLNGRSTVKLIMYTWSRHDDGISQDPLQALNIMMPELRKVNPFEYPVLYHIFMAIKGQQLMQTASLVENVLQYRYDPEAAYIFPYPFVRGSGEPSKALNSDKLLSKLLTTKEQALLQRKASSKNNSVSKTLRLCTQDETIARDIKLVNHKKTLTVADKTNVSDKHLAPSFFKSEIEMTKTAINGLEVQLGTTTHHGRLVQT